MDNTVVKEKQKPKQRNVNKKKNKFPKSKKGKEDNFKNDQIREQLIKLGLIKP